jgi:signal transduction histidine kinase
MSETKRDLRSPTVPIIAGFTVTLVTIAFFSAYTMRQIGSLRDLQTRTVDRNRKDSLQLLRIQNNLHSLELAMRDILDGDEPYPLAAWKGQFDRTRADLDDALQIESRLGPALRDPERQYQFTVALNQFWLSAGKAFEMSAARQEEQARSLVRHSLQSQQASLNATVARLLVQNNEADEEVTAQIHAIYGKVWRHVYVFMIAMLLATLLTGLLLVRSNRALFNRLAALSEQRSVLARRLITTQEEVLRSVARELHDEFGQILTAIGTLLSRAVRREQSQTTRRDLEEIRDIAQTSLEKTRDLSRALRPSILDESGIETALEAYLPTFERRTGIRVAYEKTGSSGAVADGVAIHVYRVLQESLGNIARHSKSHFAWVRVMFDAGRLRLEVEDHGIGLPPETLPGVRGIGLVGMRERAELAHGTIEFLRPRQGGTLVRMEVPLG